MLKRITILNKDFNTTGTLLLSGQTKCIIIFIHGLFSGPSNSLLVSAAHFFHKNQTDTFCFDLYHKNRKFGQTTLEETRDDIQSVINYFYTHHNYKQITLIGHSMGCFLALYSANTKINSLVLWDPSLHPKDALNFFQDQETENFYVFPYENYSMLYSKKIFNKLAQAPSIKQLTTSINIPVKIITSEYGADNIGPKYFNDLADPKSYVCIKKADHNFSEINMQDKLFRETLTWIKKSHTS